MAKFKITPTPRELDTFSADVEVIAAGWENGTGVNGAPFVILAETTTEEGYSVPVRLTLDAASVRDLRRDLETYRL